MISVYMGKAGDKRQIISKGHAGYGAYGEDIVCAAVSALINSFAIWLDESGMDVETMEMEDGFVNIVFADPENTSREPLRMLTLGLDAIQEKYFSNLGVNRGEIIF